MVKTKSRLQTEKAAKAVVVRKSAARLGLAGSSPAKAIVGFKMNNQDENQPIVEHKDFSPAIDREIEEYKKFAFDRNMIQVAIGMILGNAFQKTVTGLSDFLIMPIVNYFVNSTDGNWRDLKFSPFVGMNIEIGRLAGLFCDFFIITVILYIIYSKILIAIWPEIRLRFK